MPFGYVAAAVAVAGSVYSASETRKGAKEQNRAQRRAEQLQGQRNRVKALRERRTQTAQIVNNAASSGAGGSASQGAAASVTSQTNSAIGFGNQLDQIGSQVLDAQARQSRGQFVGAVSQAIGSYGNYGG